METWKHFLLSLIIAILMHALYEWKALFILIGGVLIDIDHYVWYIYKYRKFNLIDCYKFYADANTSMNFKPHFGLLHVFHTLEFLLAVAALSFYNEFALLFLVGLIGHYLLDLIWYITVPKCIIADHSIIHWIVKNQIQKV
ncbi:hypothetical protein HYY70_00015 [Candidatus Woesearchaeota archaeon]|nr:hypothetical protein [Candidatus Woesearchaeota archaeon]